MKVVAVAADIDANIARIRLVDPLSALQAEGGCSLRCRSLHDCSLADLAWADVLVLQRPVTPRALRLLQRMRRSGGRVVVEIDDLLTRLPDYLEHYSRMQAGGDALRRGLAAADLVTVSTRRLGEALAPLAPRWIEVPNAAWSGAVPARPEARVAMPTTLLLASSDRVAPDFAFAAVADVQRERGNALRLVCIGPPGEVLAALGATVERWPVLPRAEFVARIAALPDALAAIALDDSGFSACKSAIKYFDYAVCGVAVLCSDVPPYRDVVVHDRTGALVANTRDAWAAALRRALDDPAWRRRVAAAARDEVRRHHGFDRTVAAWRIALASLPPPAQPRRETGGRVHALAERWAARLRALNRARLARRDARRQNH